MNFITKLPIDVEGNKISLLYFSMVKIFLIMVGKSKKKVPYFLYAGYHKSTIFSFQGIVRNPVHG